MVKSQLATIRGRLQRPYDNWRGRRHDKIIANLLYGLPVGPPLDAPVQSIAVGEINSEPTARLEDWPGNEAADCSVDGTDRSGTMPLTGLGGE